MRLLLGDCIDKLKELDDNSIDSIVTDPPYGLSFMGKEWDKKKATQETKSQVVKGLGAGMKMTTLADNIEFEKWVTEWASECMRVLKPGGYMLAFGGSRMYHRLASGVENAGFEIRDQMMWVYGSGFPKSMNISKYIDKQLGTEKIVGKGKAGKTALGQSSGYNKTYNPHEYNITEPGSELAEKWNGWGTALKPAHEPIVMARKPLSEKTVVDNVLEWGTGGINIDESRIGVDKNDDIFAKNPHTRGGFGHGNATIYGDSNGSKNYDPTQGRFPANIIFDEEAGKILDEQSGNRPGCTSPSDVVGSDSIFRPNQGGYQKQGPIYGDSGGASRFFYCPKTSKTDRNEGLDDFEDKYYAAGNQAKAELKRGNTDFNANKGKGRDERHNHNQVGVSKNNHPTVKPTDLMLYLIRLVTPKGGTTLDPFMGSGSTGKAAVRGGFDFVGVEMDKEYMEIATARIQYEKDNPYNEEKGERIEINKNHEKFW
jgi:site-specific DNA-methyltransferase (adenine-specific)